MRHTPEPWKWQNDRVFSEAPELAAVGSVEIFDSLRGGMGGIADAQRAVVCVNALAGIADPAKTLQMVREALEITLHKSARRAGFGAELKAGIGGRIFASDTGPTALDPIVYLRMDAEGRAAADALAALGGK